MTTKHTPGPWILNGYISDKNGVWLAAAVAQVDDSITKANARLIAAAPELLKALTKGNNKSWVHNVAHTNDIEALRAICLEYSNWWNLTAMPIIKAATGEA